MASLTRQKRVAERIRTEVADLFQRGMKDPRLELVSVTTVNIDRELEHASVFVSTVGDAARREEVMRVLKGAKGFIRREVGRRVQLRRTPELIFHWDPSPEKVEHVAQLLEQLKSESRPSGPGRVERDDER
jgi:ribosome-binding factor A